MSIAGQNITSAAVFGASGGIGRALVEELAARGVEHIHAGSRSGEWTGNEPHSGLIRPFRFDYSDEDSIAGFAGMVKDDPPDLVIVATGLLTLPDGTGPERSYRNIDAKVMREIFETNTFGPALVGKYMLPLMPRDRRSVFAALSARVGSISDNRLGGWHSYRASKAALNMLIRNFAIELSRTQKQALAIGLHPGTVDTALSQPFQGNVPNTQLFTPQKSASALLDVIDGLTPENSGGQFDWQGERVPD